MNADDQGEPKMTPGQLLNAHRAKRFPVDPPKVNKEPLAAGEEHLVEFVLESEADGNENLDLLKSPMIMSA